MQTAGYRLQAVATDGTVLSLVTDAPSIGEAISRAAARFEYRGLVLWAVTLCIRLEC